MAARGRATLDVAYANDPLLVAAAAVALHDRTIAQRSATELRAFVRKTLSRRARTDLLRTVRVSTGDPAAEILKAAARLRSDLIVLGTHGLTGADRLIIGSTTLSVLQRTTLPVLAIPARSTTPPHWPGESIVAALELDAKSPREIEIASRVAEWLGTRLVLLHVVTGTRAPAWVRGDLAAHDRIRAGRAEQQLNDLARAARRRVPTDTHVVCGNAADEIAAFAATARPGFVMTALRDRRGWFGARRGSLSHHVLSYAVSPVLAYPETWQPHVGRARR